MNYFSHGRDFVGQPYVMVGTALPDLLSVVDRKVRVREKHAGPFLDNPNTSISELARGIVQHHGDDRWFHQSRVFNELCLSFTAEIREFVPTDRGFRPSFLGHILVELLLDAALIETNPSRLDDYYDAFQDTDHQLVEDAVNQMATATSDRIATMMGGFCRARFLYDYQEDGKLLKRLNAVMRRVGLMEIPDSLLAWLPTARRRVYDRRDDLLDRPDHRQQ